MRTGYIADSSSTPGSGNCQDWSNTGSGSLRHKGNALDYLGGSSRSYLRLGGCDRFLQHCRASLVRKMNNVIRVVIRITHPWAGTLLLICFLVGLTLSASVIAPELRSSQQVFPAAAFIPSTAGRHFYVTYATYAPGTAPTACSAGYHMASVWEILDMSDLAYDYNQPDAKTVADSGFGPPLQLVRLGAHRK